MVLLDAEPFDPRIFERGNPNRRGAPVSRRFLSAFDPEAAAVLRTAAAGWIWRRRSIDPQNPLTARVLVNRTWMHHFGVGLVRTPGDFGVRSDPPTHPELLDDLAASVVEHGWSWKWLHRQILSSAVYQQASLDRPECARRRSRQPVAVENEPPPARSGIDARRPHRRGQSSRRPARRTVATSVRRRLSSAAQHLHLPRPARPARPDDGLRFSRTRRSPIRSATRPPSRRRPSTS